MSAAVPAGTPASRWARWRTEKRIGVTTAVLRITGTVTGGQGLAATNYVRVIAAASAHSPQIANCGRFGTINVRLDQAFDKSRADIWTPKVSWRPVVRLVDDVVEEFGFVSVKLEYPIGGALHEAWVILPSGHTATYHDPYLVEIIAAELISGQRLRSESLCAVWLDHGPARPRPSSFGNNWKPLLLAPSLW
jgi:CTP-dependent riboflavin kinase